jgi:flagellar basal-body rod modification protein FlgD
MATTSALSSTVSSTGAQAGSGVFKTAQNETQQFLSLLVTQLQNQDPSNPIKDQDFLSQLAQFQTLEQQIQLTQQNQTLMLSQTLASASALIGKLVEVQGADGSSVVGQVDSVVVQNGQANVMVQGQAYALANIVSVSAPAAAG